MRISNGQGAAANPSATTASAYHHQGGLAWINAQGTSLAAASQGHPRLCSHSARASTAFEATVEKGNSARASNTVGTSTQLIAGMASRFTGKPMSGTEPNSASVNGRSAIDTII